jgi:hypothetical protein
MHVQEVLAATDLRLEEQGELSSEAVLDQLAKLSRTKQM